ncbi:MAG: DUF1501 domain-containing protein [Gemmatales bacterium]|nr:DUF1501 domain-containing protein [Gemmatales bacterium]MDW8385780.1 DUF1501 domain-containing protein [Gemmatales bacterium]
MQANACRGFQKTLMTRRHVLQAGALGVAGLTLNDVLSAEPRAKSSARARSVILLFMWGGPSHIDTWDPKPEAPAEIRGEFRPIPTTVPGLIISEHFPRLARLAHRYAVVRSMGHTDPAHLSPVHHLMTGHVAPTPNSDAAPATRNDHPHFGAMLARLKPSPRGVPTCVQMPWQVSHPAAPGGTAPGQHAGWLGNAFDPFLVSDDPNRPDFRVAGLSDTSAVTAHRHDLLRALDRRLAESGYDAVRQRAFDLLLSDAVVRAFDLNREPPCVRDRYGRNTHGQACLLARRLVEAGVRLVCVNWHNDGAVFWDTHGDNFNALKKRLMPMADQGFSALLEDLDQSGLLDETLVVWVGEFGRHPKITAGNAGREHWPQCYSAVLAGAGVRQGIVYGASDKIGAYPATPPISPADLTATIAFALGLDPHLEIRDRLDRPMPLVRGNPLLDLFG